MLAPRARMLALVALRVCLAGLPVPTGTAPSNEEVEGATVVYQDGRVVEGDFTLKRREGDEVRARRGRGRYRPVDLIVAADGAFVHPEAPGLGELDACHALVDYHASSAEARADRYFGLRARLPDPTGGLGFALLLEAVIAAPDHAPSLETIRSLSRAGRVRFARSLSGRAPDHAVLEPLVAELLPEAFRRSDLGDTAAWLDFLSEADRLGITVLHDPNDESLGFEPERRRLGTAMVSKIWGRADLIAYRTEHLLVITPLDDPRLLLLCLIRGQSVAKVLNRLFAGFPASRKGRYPMTVFLFESEAEYLAKGEHVRGRGEADHVYTAGKFYEVDQTSRFYLPEGEDRVGRVLNTLEHELTHHWIHSCCPAYSNESLVQASELWRRRAEGGDARPGHWIVEGFASLLEELVFDDATETARWGDPGADRLEIVAHVSTDRLVPWERVFGGSHLDFHTLDLETPFPVEVDLGDGMRTWQVSQRSLYYCQAVAACRYLFATEDGRFRDALLGYVIAYETGEPQSVREAFGLSPEELGRRSLSFAKAHWKPREED